MEQNTEKSEPLKPLKSFSHGRVLGAIILDSRYPKGENTPPIYSIKYRLTFDRTRKYFGSGYYVTIKDWEKLPTAKSEKLIEIKKLVVSAFDIIEAHIKEIKDNFSFDILEIRLGRGKINSVYSAYEARIKDLNEKGQVGTASIYNSASYSLKLFKRDLLFNEVTVKFLESYERFITTPKEDKEFIPISYSTLSMYLRTLRTLFNIAIRDGSIPSNLYPFSKEDNDGKYKIKEGSGTHIALTLDQMSKIINYQTPFQARERSKNLFLFLFYCGGINIKDALLLQWKNIVNNEIIFTRAKTARTTKKEILIRIPITQELSVLIDKLGTNERKPETRLLPFMPINPSPEEIRRITLNTARTMNKHLVKIGKELSISGVSSGVARHSLATILKNSGTSESFIKEVLGHTDIKTTQRYLKSFETEQRREQFEKLGKLLK